MALPTLSKATKAELVVRIANLDAQLMRAGREAQGLREQLAMAAPVGANTADVPTHKAYYAYIAAQRKAAQLAGRRVATYKTFAQWVSAQQPGHVVPNDEWLDESQYEFDQRNH
jgi:hypothetical protein